MNIKEIRDRFPQYADIPDRELLNAIREKYYSDIPVGEFYKQVGFDTRAEQKREAPGSNPLSGMSERLGNMGNAALSGFAKSGPLGAFAGLYHEGLKQGTELMDRGAYKAGGAVTDIATKAGASPEVAAGAGLAANVGVQALPSILGGTIGKAAAPVFDWAAKSLMQSALKPTPTMLRKGIGERAVKTALEHGINATASGAAKAEKLAEALNAQVKAELAAKGGTVSTQPVHKEIAELLNKMGMRANPLDDVAAINKAAQEFFRIHGSKRIPIEVANDIKSATQSAVRKKYGEMADASREAQKRIARGLRIAIEKEAPSVAAPNALQADLWNAANVIANRAALAGNRDIAGLAPVAADPRYMAAMLADRNSPLKSILARILYAGKERIPQTIGAIIGADQGQQMGYSP